MFISHDSHIPSLNVNENSFVLLLRSCQIIRPYRRLYDFVICLICVESLKHRDACPNWTMVESIVSSRCRAIAFRRIRKTVCAERILVF
jgi:hypothetical protein